MKREPEKFGFFAPKAPPPQSMPKIGSELLLSDIVKTDAGEDGSVPDPVGEFVRKAEFDELQKRTGGTVIDFDWGSIVGIADSGELEKAAHPDGIEVEHCDDGQVWKFHYQAGKLVKSELSDPHLGHMTFDERGVEIA